MWGRVGVGIYISNSTVGIFSLLNVQHPEIREVTVHLDPDEREELNRRGVTFTTLMDTPDVYDRKVRKVVKDCGGLGAGSLGVTHVDVVYTGKGTVKVQVCLALPLHCTINEGNAIGRRVRYMILEQIEEVEAVDVVAELEEVRRLCDWGELRAKQRRHHVN